MPTRKLWHAGNGFHFYFYFSDEILNSNEDLLLKLCDPEDIEEEELISLHMNKWEIKDHI